ncbi:DNA repair and recombination protein RadB [archaeon]|nr:DNA repair and recombination protein RadB [archaeon]MBL7056644.1 DNA repair and recombination protein RadB [Candidatus Woesearchaeota archaeon]
MDTRIGTGSDLFDELLAGGYEKDVITTVYGPAGSGKTNLCLMLMAAFSGKKTIVFIDTEGSFSLERLKQITPDYEAVMSKSIFFKPTNFEEQKEIFSKLKEVVEENIGLVILDSVAMLYRLEMGKSKDVYNVNKELGIQLSYLSEIARKKNIPVVVTNQVYSDFDNKDKVRMVGGDLLKYSSKCLIELQKVNGARTAILKKHRSLPDGKQIFFKIINEGIKKVEEKN